MSRLIVPVLLVTGACARPQVASVSQACSAAPYALGAETDLSSLGGTFSITVVATSGDSSGREATGRLVLEPTQRAGAAFVGRTDVTMKRLGAYEVGELDVSGDSAPGVLVFDRRVDPPSVMLRLGSGANALGVAQPIEGEFTVLLVHRLDSQGFAGPWRSSGSVERAAGHYCATRLQPDRGL